MKITINFEAKEITLDSTVSLGEFIDKITKILPDYKEFKLKVNIISIPTYPVVDRPLNNPFIQKPFGTITYG